MIPPTAQLNQLPEFWQEQIRKLRSENRAMRARLRASEERLAEFEASSDGE